MCLFYRLEILPHLLNLSGEIVAAWLPTGDIVVFGYGSEDQCIADMIALPLHRPDVTWDNVGNGPV